MHSKCTCLFKAFIMLTGKDYLNIFLIDYRNLVCFHSIFNHVYDHVNHHFNHRINSYQMGKSYA